MNNELNEIAGGSKFTESQMIALRYIKDTLEHVKILAVREGLIIAEDIQDVIDEVIA